MTLPHSITGPAGAPVVLFLHGFMGNGRDWSAVVDRLAGDVRCLTVDLPGHGGAVGLTEAAYTFPETAAALAGTLDALGIGRCRVVGYSLGGRLALYFALRHPGRCTRLVLESASPGLRTPAERAERRRIDAWRAETLAGDFEGFLDRWSRMPIFRSLGDDARAAFVAARLGNDPAELARSLRGSGTGQQPSLWEALGDLTVPTLAVAGAADPKFADLAFAMSVAGPTVIPMLVSAGHTVHAEQPRLFAALVRDFLRDPVSDLHPVLA
ncbi:MAG: 2-succinyl-6-hydroxy-2,4-cyclohexadiene-1-carboxylate synthase [Bacteroidota bacterium]